MTDAALTAHPGFAIPSTLALPTRVLEPGDTLYEEGREASSLYIVGSGVLKAIVPTSMGKERIADLYGPGDVLGTAALDGGLHAETVQAVHDAQLTPLDPQQAMNDKRLREYILRSLARQLRHAREALDDAELPVGARVTRAFLRLTERFGQASDSGEGVKLPLALTHEDLASLTGSSRVTITRILGELRQEGALSGTRGVYLANPKGLEAATDEYVMQVL
ncbi:Crp/Fnr family transcriptional regulator [Truepera radiovictrix]|uniref:Transcriptional regulator, Crp/Fnr family n=1 Tax=Truepera radiovictrix (strain DSM 17093 / CIP 108686 / LMG 22925 / RQ-24) TaxID=649638 RepID=D7CTF8_TRURR|nr:Crp/Fnr family transcriptional regulator [Truepera radiovictrix]ADI13815.1 transcriptional regulator, Crp/Fnr family [Truepera radiovictrix DSM 17093]WMT57620.1 Crp/Fnr family transcriptional regulator [Truepera radiovictrix]